MSHPSPAPWFGSSLDPLYLKLNGLLRLGAQRPLQMSDIGSMPISEVGSSAVSSELGRFWTEELKLPKHERSLIRALRKMVGTRPLLLGGLLSGCMCASTFAGPMVLKALLEHFSGSSVLPPSTLWILAGIMFFAPIFGGICGQMNINMFSHIAVQIRGSLIMLAFSKSLKLSPKARIANAGTLNNIFSTDTENLANFLVYVYPIFFSPVQLAVGLALVFQEVGSSTFVALGYIVAIMPGLVLCGVGFGLFIEKKLVESDKRIKLTKELLNGIRITKYMSWEAAMLKKLSAIRFLELVHIQRIFYCWIGLSFFIESVACVCPILIFYCFSALGNSLTYSKAFTTISLIAIITGAAATLPGIFTHVAYAKEAARRVQNLLNEDETEEYVIRAAEGPDSVVVFQEASFGWVKDDSLSVITTSPADSKLPPAPPDYQALSTSVDATSAIGASESLSGLGPADGVNRSISTLTGLSLSIPRGKLVAIVGGVGSGKSSMLSAVLNDCYCFAGSVTVAAKSMAYHSQTPFILNATIRDNIVFGLELDEAKLSRVLEMSALKPDLAALPAGLETEIGERGINISGGQKARVSFARCLYREADITLLDDPLSAVDAHTCDILFHKGIKSLSKAGKTVLLVTHQTHLLTDCDLVCVLSKDGTVKSFCPFSELESESLSFCRERQESTKVEQRPRANTAPTNVRDARARSASGATASSTKILDPGEGKLDEGALVVEEERKEGMIPLAVYVWFARAGGMPLVYWTTFLCLASKCANLVATFVLAAWGQSNATKPLTESENTVFLGTYAWILLMGLGLVTMRTYAASVHGVRGGHVFHRAMMSRVLRAPVSWFDVTPTGRILNRFTGDLQLADQGLTALIVIVVTLMADIIAAIVAIAIATSGTFLPLFVPLSFVYWQIQLYYRKSNTEVRRLVALSRSPVFSEIAQTLAGVSCISACGRTTEFVNRLAERTDTFTSLNLLKQKLNCWLCIRNDALGATISGFICCLAVATANTTFMRPEVTAVALTYSFIIPMLFGVIFSMTAEIEGMMSAIERIKEYVEQLPVEEEEDFPDEQSAVQTKGGDKPKYTPVPDDWPSRGAVKVCSAFLRYRDGPLVLKGLDFEVASGTTVGIAGRTGSGKSSLLAALFRISPLETGAIWIDGVDISTVKLTTLRSRLGIIPQDPTMFAATLRFNLDPLGLYSDMQLFESLDAVGLKEAVAAMPGVLDAEIIDGGENLSQGQRQLICFARAILRKPKIIVLDEATASVDNNSDAMVQIMVKEKFQSCTVLSIAHRLHTIKDSDRILVLDAGKVAEFDGPEALLEKGGLFASMWATYQQQS